MNSFCHPLFSSHSPLVYIKYRVVYTAAVSGAFHVRNITKVESNSRRRRLFFLVDFSYWGPRAVRAGVSSIRNPSSRLYWVTASPWWMDCRLDLLDYRCCLFPCWLRFGYRKHAPAHRNLLVFSNLGCARPPAANRTPSIDMSVVCLVAFSFLKWRMSLKAKFRNLWIATRRDRKQTDGNTRIDVLK